MANPVYPTFAFIGFVLVLIPLPWHLQSWNAGTCLFMIWTALGCLIHFVNSLVWAGNIEVHSAPWCDISTKLIVGLSVALPCASLCINRRLYSIAKLSQVHTSKAEKRRGFYVDVAIGVGVPVIVMVLHYIVQGHRFDIFEDIGCWPSTVNMAPSYPLVWIWPVVIGLISMVYCVLSIRAFLLRRIEFRDIMTKNQTMSMNRYFRLMALATTEIITTVPLSIYFIHLNLTTEPLSPWVSWSDTKWGFSRIDFIPAWVVNANPTLKLNFSLNIWLFPACAFLFFAFFGLAEEARRNYKALYYRFLKQFGVLPKPKTIRAQQVGIVLNRARSSSFGTSGHKWDEQSISAQKVDEQFGDIALPRPVSFPRGIADTDSIDTPRTNSPPPLSFIATKDSAHADLSPSIPSLTITRPDCEVPSAELQQLAASSQHPPSSSLPPLDCQESTIGKSELPCTGFHDCDPVTLSHGMSNSPAYPVLHGGIHITVERYVQGDATSAPGFQTPHH